MESKKIIFQRIRRRVVDKYELAEKYYSLLATVNDISLTKREIQLIAFIAIHGSISYVNNRQQFVTKYKTSEATINNLICNLKKLNIIIKEGGKIKINPNILLDFNNTLKLEINLENE